MLAVLHHIQNELQAVRAQLGREIYFKAAKFDELVTLPLDDLDQTTCPAIVLAVSRACGLMGPQSVAMAVVLQFVYLADKVHRLISDGDDIPEELRQFPVLVGDFLYGKFFMELCREQLLEYLAPIAQAIETMSQGTIARWLNRNKYLNAEERLAILARERAALTGLAARIGAQLAEAPQGLQEKCEKFGYQLGLAWAAWQEPMERQVIDRQLSRAAAILAELPETPQFRVMAELYDYVAGRMAPQLEL